MSGGCGAGGHAVRSGAPGDPYNDFLSAGRPPFAAYAQSKACA
jgi:hypothetical protein